MIFIDTNYFLRLLIGEPADQHLQAKTALKKAAAGEIQASTTLIVIFEIYWVTSSFYNFDKDKVGNLLKDILRMEFIEIENRKIIDQALDLYLTSNFDLEDAYNLVYSKSIKAGDFLTFDMKLAKRFKQILHAK